MFVLMQDSYNYMNHQNMNHSQKSEMNHSDEQINAIADEIADEPNIANAISRLKTIKNNTDTYKKVKESLLSMFSLGEESEYYSKCNLNLSKLQILEYIMSEQALIDPAIFKAPTIYHLIAIAKGYLSNQSLSDKEKNSKIKFGFMKNVKKDSNFWQLSQLQNLCLNLIDRTTGYRPSYSPIHHAKQIQKIDYLFSFYESNPTYFPVGIDFWSYIFKMLLCFRHESEGEKLIFAKILERYFNYDHHMQITRKNYKFAIQFYRNSYNDKECLYCPQRSILIILARYKVYELDEIFMEGSIGLYWSQDDINSSIINCIKLGITDSCCKLLIAFITLGTNQRKYQELLYAFEFNIAKIFVFLRQILFHSCRFKNLFKNSMKILKFMILSPFPTLSLYQKFVQKAIPLLQIIDESVQREFIDFLQVVMFAYKDITSIENIEIAITSSKNYQKLQDQELKRKLQEYAWKIQGHTKIESPNKQIQTKEYKGLVNIGNSCYMNSFLQALFMNVEFRVQILKISTLSLQQESLKKANLNELTTQAEKDIACKRVRQNIRPLAELQRLFSLMLRSKRPQISPISVKNVAAPQFRNTHQQDSIQYGHSLLDQISKSSFHNYFQGEMTIQIVCSNCNQVRSKREAFIDLILSTEKDQEPIAQMISKSFEEEIIQNLTCDLCNTQTQKSIKKHFISKYPNYLILSIKRFLYSVEEKKNKKITNKIIFSESLLISGVEYSLYSIIIHRGPSANSGHYFTFSKQSHKPQSPWICHNDSEVNAFSNFQKVNQFLQTNLQDTPYIFFFQKKSHIQQKKQEFSKPIILRKPLQNYIQKDNMEYLKSLQKPTAMNLSNLKFNYFYKKDDDEEDDSRNSQFNHFNSFIS